MRVSHIFIAAVLSSTFALAQAATVVSTASSGRTAALPIVFTKTVRADRARTGDIVHAKTLEMASLASGQLVPAGTEVVGHVTAANAFVYDKAPYATQKKSVLAIHFDMLRLAGRDIPLKVGIRAMADPLTSWGAREPESTDLDSLGTVTQIGGDRLVPSQDQVINRDGDVVAHNRHDGVYARLVAHAGCDGSANEVPVGIYSASACGLYGFAGVAARDTGSIASPSTLSLVSIHMSPTVWRNSTALLEILPESGVAR